VGFARLQAFLPRPAAENRYGRRNLAEIPLNTYYEARKPFLPVEELAPRALQQTADDVLDIEDVGESALSTRA
jgi:hypothetical protein